MENNLEFRVNIFTRRTSCHGVFEDYYIIADTRNKSKTKENVIPLDLYFVFKHVIGQMFIRNSNEEEVYLWAFPTINEPDTQKCYKITKKEHELHKAFFIKPVVYEKV